MENNPVVQSVKSLNFQPLRIWPESLPALTWDGHVYAGFGRTRFSESIRAYNRFENAFYSAYPNIGLSQLSRFFFLDHPFAIDWTFFFSLYRLRFSEELIQSLKLVSKLDPGFQAWIDEKGCTPRELSPLQILTEAEHKPLCQYMGRTRPAKSQGIQALEIAVDMILLKKEIFTPAALGTSFEQWFTYLKRERNPEREQSLADLVSRLKQAPWPRHVSAGPVELGDRLVTEVKFIFSEPDQLNMMAEQLKSCAQFLKANANSQV